MNRKGVSMISLVVIIIVTIILVGIATTAGYRYIMRANDVRAEALGNIIGSAALRRQNDLTTGTATSYYEGYLFNVDLADYSLVENLPTTDENNDNIPDVLQEEGSLWYVFDAESATSLGADKTEQFLTRNITYYFRNNLTDDQKKEEVRLVLADYTSGQGYYVRMPASVVIEAANTSGGACPNSPTGTHKFTVATCTEDSKCIYNCGTNDGPKALGHDWVPATCTSDGYCNRCKVPNPNDLALGHLLITNMDVENTDLAEILAKRDSYMIASSLDPLKASDPAWIADANKHWHECVRCGEKFEEEAHNRSFASLDDSTHQEACSICAWQSVVSKHKLTHTAISESKHKVVCEACNYEAIHNDTGWIDGNAIFHYRECVDQSYCNDLEIEIGGSIKPIIFKEAHYDHNNDYICDVCGRLLDTTPPGNFGYEDYNSYAKVIEATTSTITLEAFTTDKETRIDYYQFGILDPTGTIEWRPDLVTVSSATELAHYTFEELDSEKEYTFYVRATDLNGNTNTPYLVTGRTTGFPEFKNITDVPSTYVKGPILIGVEPVSTTLPDIGLMYRQNNGAWSGPYPAEGSYVSLEAAMSDLKIELDRENEKLEFKFVDIKGNESQIWTYDIGCIDKTPPTITVVPKAGDNYGVSAMSHLASVTLKDTQSGIDKNTEVKYGWSTSSTVPPTNVLTMKTPNLETAEIVSFDIATPEGLNGTYYLWVFKGTKDKVGNEIPTDTISQVGFVIDDEQPKLSNIKMVNKNPASEVPNEKYFVRTGGEVTVTFTSDKDLRSNPIIRINGVNMTSVTHSGKNWTCKLRIDSTLEDGTLQLYIGDVISVNGRVSSTTYSNSDLVEGPVYYDKTLPAIEYINKK